MLKVNNIKWRFINTKIYTFSNGNKVTNSRKAKAAAIRTLKVTSFINLSQIYNEFNNFRNNKYLINLNLIKKELSIV
jgi:hypothetical protein